MIEDEIDKVLNKNFSNKKSNQSNNYKKPHNTIQKQVSDSNKYLAKKPTTIIQKLTAVAVVLLLFSVATIGLWSPYMIRQNPLLGTQEENTVYATRFSDDSFFSIVVLPDTQFYSKFNPEIFFNQTQWIVDNKETLNIVYVVHEGDLVENADSVAQWQNADAAMSLLEDPDTTNLEDGMAYTAVRGNHDGYWQGSYFNEYFGVNRFTGRKYYGGSYLDDCNMNNYVLFDAYGLEFIAIGLNHGPSDDELSWANDILTQNSQRRAIVITHSLLNTQGEFFDDAFCPPYYPDDTYDTSQIYESLKHNKNLFMMLCGHIPGESRRTDTYNDNTIYSILANYQSYENGGNGFLRIMTFYPSEDTIHVQTYSPWADQYRSGDQSEFTLDYCLQIPPPENPLEKPGWELVFNDEFSEKTLNTSDWRTDLYHHTSESYWEPQYYTTYGTDYRYIGPDNLPIGNRSSNFIFNTREEYTLENTTEGGEKQILHTLSLVYRKEPGLKYFPAWMWNAYMKNFDEERGFYFVDQQHPTTAGGLKDAVYGPMNDTSGWIETLDRFTYGFFEIRCKIPNKGRTMWPAFWLWHQDTEGGYRELDVFEFGGWVESIGMTLNNTPLFGFHNGKYSLTNYYEITGPYANVSKYFHTYALRWTPNVVVWYVDNVERWRISGDSPQYDMRIVANVAAHESHGDGYTALDLPMEMEIDYIRAYKKEGKEFLTTWDNLTASIGEWDISENDYYINGRFSAGAVVDNTDRLLTINTQNGIAKLLKYRDDNWGTIWENKKTGVIGHYQLDPNQDYVFLAAEFTGTNSIDELLAINTETGKTSLLKLIQTQSGFAWQQLWSSEQNNGGIGNLAGDSFSFTVGDFNGDGIGELYISNSETYAARIVQYQAATNRWVVLWKADDVKSTPSRVADVQLAGDFSGEGKDLFLSVNTQLKKASLYEFTGSGWNQLWNNGDTGIIYWWNIGEDDTFISGDFTGDGQDELMAFSKCGAWTQLMNHDNSGYGQEQGPFQWMWANEGSGSICKWDMTHELNHAPSPRLGENGGLGSTQNGWTQISYPFYLSGCFTQGSQADLFCVNAGFGWAHLATYTELP
jgi:hypothetical protein